MGLFFQPVSTSGAAAEAAVFCHAYSKPRETAAAGPPPAKTLQLHPSSLNRHQRQRHHSPHPQTWPLRLPPGSDGKRWPLTFSKERDVVSDSDDKKTVQHLGQFDPVPTCCYVCPMYVCFSAVRARRKTVQLNSGVIGEITVCVFQVCWKHAANTNPMSIMSRI